MSNFQNLNFPMPMPNVGRIKKCDVKNCEEHSFKKAINGEEYCEEHFQKFLIAYEAFLNGKRKEKEEEEPKLLDFEEIKGFIENINSDNVCELFKLITGDNVIYSKDEEAFYFYDNESGLWAGGKDNKASFNSYFVSNYQNCLNNILLVLQEDPPEKPRKKASASEINEYYEYEEKVAMVKTAKKAGDGKNALNTIKDYLPAKYSNSNIKFNSDKNLLPLKNGVWDFNANELKEYNKSMYLTFKIPINYNAEANTELMENAMNLWFNKDEEIINFMKYWLGYSITGHTTRQEALLIWGDSAGNGKSTLFGRIMPKVLGRNFHKELKSEAFSKSKQGNNDALFKADGKRMCYIDEPRVGGLNSIDNELFKKFVSGGSMTDVEAKYEKGKDFDNMAKLVMTFQKFPELDLNDAGTLRRTVYIEQNVKFIYEEEYKKLSDEVKQSGKVQIRNDDFIDELLNKEEGLLKWFLDGAKLYINNPKMPIPEKLIELKQDIKDDENELRTWLMRNLEVSDNSELTLLTVKKYWKMNDLNFGQTKKGFNKRFMDECEKLGYKTNSGRFQKSEEKILNCARILTQEEKEQQERMKAYNNTIIKF